MYLYPQNKQKSPPHKTGQTPVWPYWWFKLCLPIVSAQYSVGALGRGATLPLMLLYCGEKALLFFHSTEEQEDRSVVYWYCKVYLGEGPHLQWATCNVWLLAFPISVSLCLKLFSFVDFSVLHFGGLLIFFMWILLAELGEEVEWIQEELGCSLSAVESIFVLFWISELALLIF